MELLQADRQPLVVAGQAFVAGAPAQAALDDPAAGQQHEAAFGLPQLDHLQVDAVLFGGLRRVVAGVALVGIGQCNAMARSYLHFFRQGAHLGPVRFGGRRDDSRQQVAQRINGHVHLAALAPFGAVVARPVPTLRRALQRARIEDYGAWVSGAGFVQAQHLAQIVGQGFKDAGVAPAGSLLVARGPGR